VAKEKGIDIILTSQVALTMNKDYDISKDVIAKADSAGPVAAPTTSAAKPPAAKPPAGAPAKPPASPSPKP